MSNSTVSINREQLSQGSKAALTARHTDELKRRFLTAFSENGNMSDAATEIGIDRTTVYYWKRTDPEFHKCFEQAREDSVDMLEDVARKRAKATSDRLLHILLKAYKPERFGDKIEITAHVKPVVLGWPTPGSEPDALPNPNLDPLLGPKPELLPDPDPDALPNPSECTALMTIDNDDDDGADDD